MGIRECVEQILVFILATSETVLNIMSVFTVFYYIVTEDETWVPHHTGMKTQSMQ